MNEVKTPKKPFYVYYAIVLLALFLINALLVPRMAGRMIKQVDYDTFMKMTLDKQIDEVEVQDNQIIFTTTLKAEEGEKYAFDSSLNNISFSGHVTNKMLSNAYVDEFRKVAEEMLITINS